MANRVGPRGLTFLGAEKHIREGKRDKYAESEIALWIEAVLEDCIPPRQFEDLLKDGVLFCRVMNIIKPGSISKIQKPFTRDAHMANLSAFLEALRNFGLPEDQIFSVEDLYEAKNIPKVVLTMLALGKKLYEVGWEGPNLGPKPTGEIKDWPEQVLRASEAIIPSQYGTNKFANQKGVRIGASRDITPKVSDKSNKENMKEWTEQQLRASESIIPAQYGTNKFATQKGIRIGASRDIMPKVSDTTNKENWKQWSDEQLRAGEAIIPLQCGTNKLATQKGIRFGGARDILPNVQYKSDNKSEE